MRVKPSFCEGEDIQFFRYYQVRDTGWFIMNGREVAGSQASSCSIGILGFVWMSPASSIQIVKIILRDLFICTRL